MFKNVASQKLIVFAFDTTTNIAKTGDAANLTAYVSKDYGAVTVLGDTSATEMDATNAKGYYLFDLTQAETNADCLLFSAKSSTANIAVIGVPSTIYTTPANFTTQSIDSSGRVDIIKIAGTTQTARDIGASVLLSSGTGTGQLDFTSGVVKANLAQILGTAITETAGQIAAAFKQFFDVASPTGTMKAITNVVTTTTATNLTNAPTSGDFTATMKTSIGTAVAASAVASVTGNVGGNVTGSVGSVTGLTASNLDTTISSRMASYTQPTGFLAATFPATVASPTNITAATGVDITKILGTAISTPATAGILDVNIKNIANAAVNTASAQLGVNVVTQANIDFGALQKASLNAATPASIVGAVGSVTSAVATTSNVKKNQALGAFEFVMTDSTTHAPKTGVTVTATRSLDGGAFAACANAATELSSGVYKIDLAATDMNANVVTLRFTGTASDDRLITVVTQP